MTTIETCNTEKKHNAISGISIICGTAVGAGMFSIPVVSAGSWTIWALIAVIGTWITMMISGLMILETNLNYKEGASFNTMVKDLLGDKINLINNLSVTFVAYILCYAYVSALGSIGSQSVSQLLGFDVGHTSAAMVLATLLALFVWRSSFAVGKLTTALIFGMIITFVMSISGLSMNVEADKLFNTMGEENISYMSFVWASLPFFLASFGYHHSVPSLVKCYGRKNYKTIISCVVIGSGLAALLYVIWLISTFGNLSRDEMSVVIQEGGNVGVLVNHLADSGISATAGTMLTWFGNFAVASSFAGVSLGLFDFIADLFKFDNDNNGRTKTALIVFIPPMLGGIIAPDGFITAIGFAALFATVWASITPALMAKASREKFGNATFKVSGGNTLIYIVITYGVLIAICHILAMLNLLPVYS